MSLRYPDRVLSRAWSRLDASGGPASCWPWTGGVSNRGYGVIYWRQDGERVRQSVHVLVAELFLPEGVPSGLQVDHLCHGWDETCRGGDACEHRRCANPLHLAAVTQQENARRGHRHSFHETCKHGHPLVEGNLYWAFNKRKQQMRRHCRECNLLRGRESRARRMGNVVDMSGAV